MDRSRSESSFRAEPRWQAIMEVEVPTTFGAVLVVVAFIIPGFIGNRILSYAHSRPEPSDGRIILEALTFSCFNYAILSWLLVLAWSGHWYEDLELLAACAFGVLFVSPVLLALALAWLIDTKWGRRLRLSFGMAHPVPKAWDSFFRKGVPCWIVATMKDGRVIAGFYGSNSFASSFPAAEDLYLEKLCDLSPQGKIKGLAEFSNGGIIQMENVSMLELFEVAKGTKNE
jgi:Family of unknown function (DUF6338)